ncbi:MAG: AEC family transporter [Sphingobium sp.]|jgi:malonate transporter|nr:AEC family transporter [Sphingobium sp.]MCI1271583.1 AEC family transporter [Sphingobium sp.]MCI1756076.1 AEC family transporter [Sphingobium sp.]MCI2052651.1 AEC family transporter [Sphingobium sp.]
MLSTLATIAPVFLMIAAGYFARKLDIMPEGSGALLTRVVTWIALPALMFHIIATTDWSALWNTRFVIANLASAVIIFMAGMGIGRLRGLPIADIAVDGLNASYSNVAYVGLPLFLLALGPTSTPYVIIAATVMLMLLFTAAVVAIELGHHRDQGIGHALGKALTGVVKNPVLASSAIGFAWWLTGWTLPDVPERFTQLLGAASSPTALVAIGLFMAERPLGEAMSNRFVLMLTCAKLILHPLITAVIAYGILGLSGLPAIMAVVIAALPTGTGPFMVAGFYARDGKVTSGTILATTLLSVITLSVLLAVLPR